MAFDFPAAPADGAEFTPVGGPTYVWSAATPGWLLKDESVVIPPVDAYTKTESDTRYVNIPGDTMTGGLTIAPPTGFPYLYLNKIDPAAANMLQGQNNGEIRWVWYLGDNAPESGGNAGTNLGIFSYADDGAYIGNPFSIMRATGVVVMGSGANTGPLNVTGNATISGIVTGSQFVAKTGGVSYVGNGAGVILSAGSAAGGVVLLRAKDDGTADATLNSIGNFTIAGSYTSTAGQFIGAPTAAVLATGAAGKIHFRPNGVGSVTGEATLSSAGVFNALSVECPRVWKGTVNTNSAGYNLQGTAASGSIYLSSTGAAALQVERFYNGNGAVGAITTNGSTTTFNTTSDANLKEVSGEYDPAEAIAIIRADPVMQWTWKTEEADQGVGWIAQKSYAVDSDLATPPPATEIDSEGSVIDVSSIPFGEEGYLPWGIDYGKRTPYLWAALSAALDKIDTLEATVQSLVDRINALEIASPTASKNSKKK